MIRFARLMTLTTLILPLLLGAEAMARHDASAHGHDASDSHTHEEPTDPIVRQELAALRQATAHFHRLDNAMASGWDTQLTDCLEIPAGGMGFHYGNMEFLLDGEANLLEPDVLVYEPQSNGRMRLVAVEYIAPVAPESAPGTPPQLFGRDLHWDEELHAWTMHAWIWKHNPDGLFEHWNPTVSCESAE